MPVDVSVIVVARNEERVISRCLDSLLAQSFPIDRMELIVVDGASSDGTREICRKYPVKLVCLSQAGISLQRNAGLSAAAGRYVAFTDADCAVERTWLEKLVRRIEKADSNIVAMGGPNLVFEDDPPLSRLIGYVQETFLGSGGSPQSYRIKKAAMVNSIPNCNIIYRKGILAGEKYDEVFSVGDDCDLNFRLRQKGYSFLFDPDIVVWHHRPGSFGEFIHKIFSYGAAMGRITRKHRRIIRWYAFASALAALTLIFSYPVIKFIPVTAYLYIIGAGIYAVALIASTVQVYRRYKNIESLLTLVLLPVQHFVYGIAFLHGLLQVGTVRRIVGGRPFVHTGIDCQATHHTGSVGVL